ncbi:MAG: ATP-binding protein [Pseudoflavonifractor sp.]|nr:ATP-binding protein [Pseudoflavonifractor sp.]
MEKILSLVRRCVEDYDMIQAGDRVAVGVSGGKDSLVTLTALARLSRFYPKSFTVEAFTLDMGAVEGGEGIDFGPVADYCAELGVPFTLVPTEICHIIFDIRKEKNPCSMCAKMRRGALHNAIAQQGIKKIALGHHFDDAVETFFLSLFYEGRLSCFQPVTELTRTGITQIRPLLYCGEGMVRGAARRNGLPVVHNPCPADGYTKRQEVKELVADLEHRYPGLKERVFGSMQRLPLPEWGPLEHRRRPLAEEEP